MSIKATVHEQVKLAGGWDGAHVRGGDTNQATSIAVTHYHKPSAMLSTLLVQAGFLSSGSYHTRGRDTLPTQAMRGFFFGTVLQEIAAAFSAAEEQYASIMARRKSSQRERAAAQWRVVHLGLLRQVVESMDTVLLQDLPLWREGCDGVERNDWVAVWALGLPTEQRQRWDAHCVSTAQRYAASSTTWGKADGSIEAIAPAVSILVRAWEGVLVCGYPCMLNIVMSPPS